MAKDLTELNDKELLNLCAARGQRIQQLCDSMTAKNAQIRNLEVALMKSVDVVESYNDALVEIERLKYIITTTEATGELTCDCSDWISIGNDADNGNKLKRCLTCNRIGVR